MRSSRKTKQKELLQQVVDARTDFFSVEELYDVAQKKDSTVGIATVYRFLREAKKTHALHSYRCGNKTIYAASKKTHCHFHCRGCGTVHHIDIDTLDFLQKKIDGTICHFQIDVEGVCKRCSRK